MRIFARSADGPRIFMDEREPDEAAVGDVELDEARRIIELAVTQVFGLEERHLVQLNRGVAQTAFARQVAMYLAHVACRMTMTEVGRLFGRDRTTVAHACRLVEDRRDNVVLDRALDLLEWSVPVMARRPSSYFLNKLRGAQ